MSHHSLRELASSACVGSSSFPASTSYSSSSFDLFIPSAKENSGATTTTGAAAVAAAGKTIGVSPAIKAVSGSFGGIIEVGLEERVLSRSIAFCKRRYDFKNGKEEATRELLLLCLCLSPRRIFIHYSLLFLSFLH